MGKINLDESLLSDMFLSYKEKIIAETGLEIAFYEKNDKRFDYPAMFVPNFKIIEIHIQPELMNIYDDFEIILAHDLAHALLKYKYKYDFLKANDNRFLPLTAMIQTMIEDIPVQKVISDYGFSTIPKNILIQLKSKSQMLKSGVPFQLLMQDSNQDIRTWRVIFETIIIWGHLKYLPLSYEQKATFAEYLKTIQQLASSEEISSSDFIKNLFNENNVFTRDGFHEIMNSIIIKWQMPFSLMENL